MSIEEFLRVLDSFPPQPWNNIHEYDWVLYTVYSLLLDRGKITNKAYLVLNYLFFFYYRNITFVLGHCTKPICPSSSTKVLKLCPSIIIHIDYMDKEISQQEKLYLEMKYMNCKKNSCLSSAWALVIWDTRPSGTLSWGGARTFQQNAQIKS